MPGTEGTHLLSATVPVFTIGATIQRRTGLENIHSRHIGLRLNNRFFRINSVFANGDGPLIRIASLLDLDLANRSPGLRNVNSLRIGFPSELEQVVVFN